MPDSLWLCGGIYCAKGTAIDTVSSYSPNSLWIVPLVDGNSDDTKYFMLKDQTPQQITEFIQSNMGDSGGKYFGTLSDGDSGMFGSSSSTGDSWSHITSETSQSQQFVRFSVRAGVSDGVVVMLRYPGTASIYNNYKTNGRMTGFGQFSLYAASNTTAKNYKNLFTANANSPITQADFNVITLVVYDFRTDAA